MLTGILLLFCSFFNPAMDTIDTREWKTLEMNDFKIDYPAEWQGESFENSVQEFTITSPYENEEDYYADFVNLAILKLPGLNKNLETYVTEFSRDIPFIYQKAMVRTNEKALRAGRECYILEYAGVFNDFPIAYRQYIWFQNESAYTLSFTAQQGSFEHWESVATKIMDSFTFKK
jgi:hypothetical protein